MQLLLPFTSELDFIVLRATPPARFESWWHNSQRPGSPSSPAPNQWIVYLMCISWFEDGAADGQPRKAERFTIRAWHQIQGRQRDRGEAIEGLQPVEGWMSVSRDL